MRNIRLTVAYEGANYHGFQIQRGVNTVQATLESVLARLVPGGPRVTGAGRTDAGVHAWGQVVNFYAGGSVPVERFPVAMNSLLPPDLVVRSAAHARDDFHARYDALRKRYQYLVFNGEVPTPFWRRYALRVGRPLDLQAMRAAAAVLVGTHDFKSFRAAGGKAGSAIRTITRLEVGQHGSFVRFLIEADGFLYKMVRNIVGTLLEIGHGERNAAEMAVILAARNRDLCGRTAPPHGLCLLGVSYEDDPVGEPPGEDAGITPWWDSLDATRRVY